MTALDDLEALDRQLQLAANLLTQADQCVEQTLQAATDFNTAHGGSVPTAPLLHQALADIQVNLHSMTDRHNQVVAQIAQLRSEAQQIPDNPY
jgi:DNA-binding MurR/RpiR family transcriptional regulator